MQKSIWAGSVLMIVCQLGGCAESAGSHKQHSTQTDRPVEADTSGHHHEHSDNQTPINCPMHNKVETHQHGHNHKPFASVEEYIDHLDREDRNQWQKPDAVVTALGLNGTESLADVGAGSGYFSFRFAKALPRGTVTALDVEPEMIAHVQGRAEAEGVENVTAMLAKPDNPTIPNDTDWVFICNVLHHIEDAGAWLSLLHDQLKPGAQVAIIEFKPGELPVGPPEWMKIAPEKVIEMLGASGFSLSRQESELLPYQDLFVFTRD